MDPGRVTNPPSPGAGSGSRRITVRGHVTEDRAKGGRGTEQRRGLHRDDQLRARAGGELREGIQLEDCDQGWTRIGRGDGGVDGGDRLGAALGLEDGRLPVALGPEDRRLALALGRLDRRLPVAVGDIDGRLLEPLRLEDLGPLLLVSLLLEGEGLPGSGAAG